MYAGCVHLHSAIRSPKIISSKVILLANGPVPPGPSDVVRPILTKECGFCDFASSLHDRWSPPHMEMWYNSGCVAGPEVAFDPSAPSLPSRRTRSPCRHRPLSPASTHVSS
jgi:hypothetical protein